MAFQTGRIDKPSIGSLLGGLLNDVRDLLVQELKLARKEIGEDIQKTKTALFALGVGLVVLATSLGLLLLMVVHLINSTTDIPLWGCYGIVGAIIGIIGVGLLLLGRNRAQTVDFAPEQTAQAVKEDVGWIRARVRSSRIAKGREPLSLRK
jgi:hypothetical protein